MKKRLFYIWFLPLLWCVFSVGSFFNSGDEHGLFALGAIAGTWIGFLYQFDTIGKALVPVIITGVITLGLIGALMDRLRIWKILWLSVFVLGATGIFILSARQFESFEHIRWKHRSILALVFYACNAGIYVTTILCIVGAVARRLWRLTQMKTVDEKICKTNERK